MARQLVLDLPQDSSAAREDFIVAGSNAAALALLETPQSWPDSRLLICGDEGSGKSHLAAIFAQSSGAHVMQASALRAADVPDLAARPALVLEDADAPLPRPEWETAFFHLLNLTRAEGAQVLITARVPPARWGLSLPDLISRLGAITLAQLEAPEDTLLSQVLVKLFADRQLQIAPQLIAYLVARMDRSLAEAARLVACLDALALERRSPVTRALAQELLDNLQDGDIVV